MRNPLSLEAFADWLEQQPKKKSYDYCEAEECAVTQYAYSLGLTTRQGVQYCYSYFDAIGNVVEPPREFFELACTGKETFGALAERARAALASADGATQ